MVDLITSLTPDQFFQYLKDSFDALYAEGAGGQPKMMSVGLHCRLIGRPGRVMALRHFMEYAQDMVRFLSIPHGLPRAHMMVNWVLHMTAL